MNETNLLLIAGIGAAAYLLLPTIASAASPGGGLLSAAGEGVFKDITLVDISGATWSIPLFLTLERDIALGIWGSEFLTTAAGITWSGMKTAGGYVSSALSTMNTVARNVVLPTIIDATKTTASFIVDIPGYTWTGMKAVGRGIKIGAGWTWDKVTGIWTYTKGLYEKSFIFRRSVEAVGAMIAGIGIEWSPGKDSKNDTDSPDIQQAGSMHTKPIPIGYLSKTSFTQEIEGKMYPSLVVTKMFHPQANDTMLVSDGEAITIARQNGYITRETLGNCASAPFRGCTYLFNMFNNKIMDHIVVSNQNAIPKLESMGYESMGILGYAKAL